MVFVTVCCIHSTDVKAQNSEYEIKATLLYFFGKYSHWPPKVFDEDQKIVLGILGDDPFGTTIDRILHNRPANGRYFEVRRGTDIKELRGAHILYMSNLSKSEASEVLDEINSKKNASVLTVGDNIDGFCEIGGILNFTTGANGNKYYFVINTLSSNKVGIYFDNKMLNMATEIISYDPYQ
ncbi:YfiR family protein [Sediminitomix flava]|uniref:Uncharacterized protein DUF4154 n=1 Tax=Sediminitomix flava TaxID=379075 RepID=A0A315ZHN2_SEDFL|nr:YfiR family protein [Sediminitomix flava]PWJ44713.1 uncharacterized protein DUF4154 [Sediminitomix flava]